MAENKQNKPKKGNSQNNVKRESNGRLCKGVVLNPAGKPSTPKEVRQVMGLTKAIVSETVAELWQMDIEQLRILTKKESGIETGKVLVARVLYMAAQKGDYMRMSAVLDRAIGKPKEEVIVDMNARIGVSKEVAEMTEEQLREVIRGAVQNLKRPPETK